MADNGSVDGTLAAVETWPGPARTLEFGEKGGFGTACNAGVRAAAHDAVVLLNPDTLLVDDSLVRLAELALELRALCGPGLLNEDGSRQPSASPPPGGWETVLDALAPAALLPRSLRERSEPWRANRRVAVGWLTGACIAAPKEILLRLGPFDDDLDLYGEDLDLGLRARRAGVPCFFAPDTARVVHLGERSTARRLGPTRVERKLRARRRVVAHHLGARRERLDFAAQVGFHATRFVAKRLLGRPAGPEREWLAAARGNGRG